MLFRLRQNSTTVLYPARVATTPIQTKGERTRATILDEAARLATVVGLDGLTIGGLANAIGMSKSGLYAHFGSKQELQLATIDAARGDLR